MEGKILWLRTSRLTRPCVARPALTLLTVFLVATSLGGCWSSPRFQAPFTLANPNERHPIAVRQGEVTLDLAVYPGSSGLNEFAEGQGRQLLGGL